MATAVVTVVSGGLPVIDVTATFPRLGLPVTEASRGIAVTKVLTGGTPVTFSTVVDWPSGGGGSGGAEAVAFLARTTGLDATHTSAYTALIDGLVTDSLWTKFDVLYVFATQDSTTAKLNLKSASYTAIANGSPSFTADRGFLGVENSSTVYLNTQFNGATAGGQYTQDNAHISVWNLTNATTSAGDGIAVGHAASGFSNFTSIAPRRDDGYAYYRINGSTSAGNHLNANAIGHYICSRATGTNIRGYKNGAESCTGSGTDSVTLYSGNTYILAINRDGSPIWGYPGIIASASIGGTLNNATDANNFYTRLRTYMTAVGVP